MIVQGVDGAFRGITVVHLAVIVEVGITDITRNPRIGDVRLAVGLQSSLGFVLNETFGGITPDFTNFLAHIEVVQCTGRIVILRDGGECIRDAYTHTIFQRTAQHILDTVCPIDAQLPTIGAHIGQIFLTATGTQRIGISAGNDHIVGITQVVVERSRQAVVQHIDIQTEVSRRHFFPRGIEISQRRRCNAIRLSTTQNIV